MFTETRSRINRSFRFFTLDFNIMFSVISSVLSYLSRFQFCYVFVLAVCTDNCDFKLYIRMKKADIIFICPYCCHILTLFVTRSLSYFLNVSIQTYIKIIMCAKLFLSQNNHSRVKLTSRQKMLVKILVFISFAYLSVEAMVCFHGICDKLPKRGPLGCKGSVIKNGGFCGCYDVCAKVKFIPSYFQGSKFVIIERKFYLRPCLANQAAISFMEK